VLTDRNDVYAWGRGFEGQLGISDQVFLPKQEINACQQVASTPQYVKYFFKKPVGFIAAGAFYSLAITI